MHKLLARQLRKYLPDASSQEELAAFLQVIDQAYRQADEDRALLERSLELSSRELTERYQQLKSQLEEMEDIRQRLEDSLSLLGATLEATNDGILVVGNEQEPITCNGVFREMFQLGLEPDWAERVEAEVENADEFRRILELVRESPDQPHEGFLKLRDGRYFECCVKPRDSNDAGCGQVWSFNDITDLKASERQALFHSYHDALTGLPNRSLLHERLEHALERNMEGGGAVAVLFIDLDGFKYINDTVSLAAGDAVLKTAAERIRRWVDKQGTLARYGGDEFIVLQENVNSSMAPMVVAENVRAALERPFHYGGEALHLSASIGIATAPGDGQDAETLIRKAHMAVHNAKVKGRNNTQFFAQELERLASHRLQMRNSLKQALARQEFCLRYQPKVGLAEGRITGVEALIRWQRGDGNWVSPGEFIPEAEQNGLMGDIGRWVLEEACRQAGAWVKAGSPLPVAVNVSVQQFQQGFLRETVEQALARHNLDPSLLELEITESLIMDDVRQTTKTLRALREQGVRIAIDDFGTGYSSLNYLKDLPIDILKIDRSFLLGMLEDGTNRALVETIIQLAHTLHLTVVAEGVEDMAVSDALRRIGCDYAQGFLFCKPVSPEQISQQMRNFSCEVPPVPPERRSARD